MRICSSLLVLLLAFGCSQTTPAPVQPESKPIPSYRMTDAQREAKVHEQLTPLLTRLKAAIAADKVAILGFYRDGTKEEAKLSQYLLPRLHEPLTKSGIKVLERRELQTIIEEQKRELSAFFDPEQKSGMGQLVGTDLIIFGYIRSVGLGSFEIETRLEDIASGQLIISETTLLDRQYIPVRYGGT